METEKQSSSLGELEFPNTTYLLRFGYFSNPCFQIQTLGSLV